MGEYIDSSNLKALRKAIQNIHEDYRPQLEGVEIEEISRSVEKFKKEYMILRWLLLYQDSGGEKAKQVVKELYRLYPEFQTEIESSGRVFPADGRHIRQEDEDYFQDWLRENSSYVGKEWGAIAWLGFMSKEMIWFVKWRENQKYKPGGLDYIPFPVWYEGLKQPPKKILVEVNISPEDYLVVKRGLPSVAQLYADHRGRVAIIQDSTLDIKTERYIKAGEVAELLQRPVKTIYNWASEGIIPCYRDGGSLRFKWDEVKEWYAQYRHKGRTSRQFK